jgi:hypothetical protein
LDRRLGGSQSRSGRGGEEKNSRIRNLKALARLAWICLGLRSMKEFSQNLSFTVVDILRYGESIQTKEGLFKTKTCMERVK